MLHSLLIAIVAAYGLLSNQRLPDTLRRRRWHSAADQVVRLA